MRGQPDSRPLTARRGKSRQKVVNRHFETQATSWRDIYVRPDVLALSMQRRMSMTLGFVDGLSLPTGAQVLEVGAGAGIVAVALAQRGFAVEATDPVPAMRELTRETAVRAGVAERVQVSDADARALPFESGRFDLVIALGVLPWITDPERAVDEMARVSRPGGHLIFGVSNQANLAIALDPPRYPILGPLRTAVRRVSREIRRTPPLARTRPMHSFRKPGFDRLLQAAGLEVMEGTIFGFGPFTFFGRSVFPDRIGTALDRRLERFGTRHRSFANLLSDQYVVLARKPQS